jgi:hypothetical protein
MRQLMAIFFFSLHESIIREALRESPAADLFYSRPNSPNPPPSQLSQDPAPMLVRSCLDYKYTVAPDVVHHDVTCLFWWHAPKRSIGPKTAVTLLCRSCQDRSFTTVSLLIDRSHKTSTLMLSRSCLDLFTATDDIEHQGAVCLFWCF